MAARGNVRVLRKLLAFPGCIAHAVGRRVLVEALMAWQTRVMPGKAELMRELAARASADGARMPLEETDTVVLHACAVAHPALIVNLVAGLRGYTARAKVAQTACALLVRRCWRDGMDAAVLAVVGASAADFDAGEFAAFALSRASSPPWPSLRDPETAMGWNCTTAMNASMLVAAAAACAGHVAAAQDALARACGDADGDGAVATALAAYLLPADTLHLSLWRAAGTSFRNIKPSPRLAAAPCTPESQAG